MIDTITYEHVARRRSYELIAQAGSQHGTIHVVQNGLKKNIDAAGVRDTAAAQLFTDRVHTEDAEVARRVFRAGAVSLGKLNLDEFAFAGTGVPGCFGPSRNPW